jgi:hypothetical protein
MYVSRLIFLIAYLEKSIDMLPRPGIGRRGNRNVMTSEREQPAEIPETALYIASMTTELARLARNHNLDALAYLLDMARMEADQITKAWNGRANGGPG